MSKEYKVDDIAALAKLRLSQDESAAMQEHFHRLLQAFRNLEELSTEGVEPMVTPHQIYSPLREDRVESDISRDELLELAPETKDSLYKVPPVV